MIKIPDFFNTTTPENHGLFCWRTTTRASF